ncbi:hypothetical protein LZ518_08510 [Sphingomonas sp. RB56-2]|uniref:Uncharacterized protein n=1 Tax=Sphingomonas brevis TaxID=2908206 RepID=A0ABT0SAQ9_9SPHN|nr:hypothetical protein [Sphingomonas brevis]MCL6741171.1 hypothetical protein [Sphingomonas brevis]
MMKDPKYSIYTGAKNASLRLIVWRDRVLPPEINPDDWTLATHLDADQVGEHGVEEIEQRGLWLFAHSP